MDDRKDNKYIRLYANVEYTMSKNDVVCMSNSYEVDSDGNVDTDKTDWEYIYTSEHYSPKELLEILSKFVREKLGIVEPSHFTETELHRILEDCEHWNVESSNFEEG